jgi:hypothetical protein
MARSWRCTRGNVVAAASAHSQRPVSVLHTDPTQLEQLSEHGMSGQRVEVVEVVEVVVVVVEVVEVVVVVVEVVVTHTPGFRC